MIRRCCSVESAIGGKRLCLEVGKLAPQTSSAVSVTYGDTVVLVTVCLGQERAVDFTPLTVDYEERLYAAGKIPGGFFRREGRPTEEAILTSRLIDRPLRPLLPAGFSRELQIVATVFSVDQENRSDVLALIGASAALHISEIPFAGPIGAVGIGVNDGEFISNPTFSQLQESPLDLVVCGTQDRVVMIEGEAKEVEESFMVSAIGFAQRANLDIIELQHELRKECGKPKIELEVKSLDPYLVEETYVLMKDRLDEVLAIPEKGLREKTISSLKDEVAEKMEGVSASDISSIFEQNLRRHIRRNILDEGTRPGGRELSQIRPISCESGILPRTHGSALFNRGQTQVLTIATLGSLSKEQRLDGLTLEESKRFIHHYNFPPFSTGEVKRISTPSRREIGHGALVEKALSAVIPREDDFPYTIRLVSEVLSSNGSTSMASTCASSLSLMDAGVPIRNPVAGIAMGLVDDGERYSLLTDIEGMEDHYGDMDFKVAGTDKGITAVQLDVKNMGLSLDTLGEALGRANKARREILDRMRETLPESRSSISKYAPHMVKYKIPQDKIGAVIGPGGRVIRSISEQAKVSLDVENDGTVFIGGSNEEGIGEAIRMIESLTREVVVGGIYTGKVTRILGFGAMVEVLPGKEGLVHISELADHYVKHVEDVVKMGDEITVVVIGIDREGRINLSRKAVFQGLPDREEKAPSHKVDSPPRAPA
jgi:polyribonucleotide nucleotidyltransferase